MTNRLESDNKASLSAGSPEHHGHEYFEQLRRKLRWQLLVTYLLPLLLLSAYFHFEYNATLREGIDNHLKSVAENQRNTIDLFLRERVANLGGAFQHEGLTFPPDAGLMEKILAELQRESTTFVDLGLFHSAGKLIAYAGPHSSLAGKDYSGEKWFMHLLTQDRSFFISDVYLGFRNKPHFIVAVRRTVEGKHWVLRASVDPEKFGEFVGSSYLLKDAEAFIVNSRGQRQTFSGAASPDQKHSQMPQRSPDTKVSEVEVSGRKYLRALAWLTENEWALVVRVPKDKACAPLVNARFGMLGIMLAAMLIILVVVFRRTKKLVGRLEATDKAKEDLRGQLFNAAKLASVGEMAAGVAHEINNPLAIIYEEASMMTDIMDPQFGQELDPDDFAERLAAIKEATMRGRTITSKLMAFARRHEPDPEPSDINLLIDRVFEIKALDFKVSNIEISRDYATDLPWVMVNRNQMDQVFLNLLNNAKDAMEGAGRLTVQTRLVDRWVSIKVGDNGRGMTPEIMEKIFYPFFTTKGVGKGTGLGLSISYGIVESLGGQIKVESEAGAGTTFTILLPCDEEAQMASGAPT
ncbi:MAG: histidine kinase [Deltaproteobacteria bacterium]|nr:histidine kinase [Deltaproteobacteria bacterium]